MIDLAYTEISPTSEGAKALILIEGTDKMVVTRRGNDAPLALGQIDLPGGRIEPGESPYNACIREVMEEIGIDLSDCPVICADAQTTSSGKLSWLIGFSIDKELAHKAKPVSEVKEVIIESVPYYLKRRDAWIPFQNHARKVLEQLEKL